MNRVKSITKKEIKVNIQVLSTGRHTFTEPLLERIWSQIKVILSVINSFIVIILIIILI